MRRALIATVAVVAALAATARAEDAPASKGPFVVLVGVGQFDDKAITARPTAEADAQDLYDVLGDTKYLGVPPDRMILLTSPADEKRKGQKATRENVLKAIHEAVAKTGKDDTIIIGWFGRGASAGDRTSLFTADTDFKERAKTSVLGADLEAELKNAKDRKLCVFLDVSFKGFDAGKEVLVEPNLRDILASVFGGDDKGELPPPRDKVVFLATTPTHDPLTKGKNGLFTATAIDALKGAADTEGDEPDGLVTVDEFVKYVEKVLTDEARTIGKTAQEKESVPFIVGEETSHFPLTKNPKVAPQAEKRAAAFADLIKAGRISKDLAGEGKDLLTRMPKLKAVRELRKKYQDLADGKLAPDDFLKERDAIKDGMKVSSDDAEKYAKNVMKAVELVRSRYVKERKAGDLVAGAIKGEYQRLDVPMPKDVEDSLKDLTDAGRDKLIDTLAAARLALGKREDLDGDKDVDIAVLMMLASLNDPYTTYYDREMIKKADSQLRGQFRGVGIQIRRDLVRDGLLVVSPIKGSPAYKAGIKAGDLITEIRRETDPNGDPLPEGAPKVISTKGMKTEQALELILGKPPVPITLMVQREGEKELKEFTIPRGVVSVETVLGVKRDAKDDWNFYIDEENKIGYLCLTQFSPTSFDDMKAAIDKLRKTGLKGLVIDLRYNPGGLLDIAVDICDLFIDDGVIVSVKPRVGRPVTYNDRGIANYADFPIAVLVNNFSASAAEILSACLQDHGRAVVVGERTYGKGSVQSIERFPSTGGQIKLTTARYFPPSDKNIDKLSSGGKDEDEWGVKPDKGYEVKLSREEKQELADFFRDREIIKAKPDAEKKAVKDKQLDKALEYVRGQMKASNDKPFKKAG